MALISPVYGQGSKISYCTTSGGTYTDFANVEKIKTNKATSEVIKRTKLSDTAVRKGISIPDYGSIEMEWSYSPADTALIKGWQDSGTLMYFKISPKDGTTTQSSMAVAAYVKDFDPMGELSSGKEVISSVTLEIDGAGTFTSGT